MAWHGKHILNMDHEPAHLIHLQIGGMHSSRYCFCMDMTITEPAHLIHLQIGGECNPVGIAAAYTEHGHMTEPACKSVSPVGPFLACLMVFVLSLVLAADARGLLLSLVTCVLSMFASLAPSFHPLFHPLPLLWDLFLPLSPYFWSVVVGMEVGVVPTCPGGYRGVKWGA